MIHSVTSEWLRWYLGGFIRFERFDKRSDEWVPKDCPPDLAKTVLAMDGMWKLPKLTGILSAPTITPEGRLIEMEGFDEATGLYLEFSNNETWQPVPEKPSVHEIQAATENLWKPFERFPFVDAVSRSGYFAALLTAMVRLLLKTAPGFFITAPTAGSGKTLLALCLAVLGGNEPEVFPRPEDDTELRKRLLALCLRGTGCIIFDNLSGDFESDCLCAFLTTERLIDRVLGASSILNVPTNTLTLLTGNNVQLVGDLGRRFISVRIDPQMETPWNRSFDLEPLQYCQDHRLEMVRAGLTILRGYLQSGAEKPKGRLASFEIWSDFIRGAVCWVGENKWLDVKDPVESIVGNFSCDPETNKLRALLQAWEAKFGTTGTTVAKAIREAQKNPDDDLWAALNEIAGEPTGINSRRLGRWIERHRGRIVEGMRFTRGETVRERIIWHIENVGNVGKDTFHNPT